MVFRTVVHKLPTETTLVVHLLDLVMHQSIVNKAILTALRTFTLLQIQLVQTLPIVSLVVFVQEMDHIAVFKPPERLVLMQ